MKAIISAAKACVASYALATQMGGNASVPASEVAAALAAHYLRNFTSFTLGSQTVFPDQEFATHLTADYLARLREKGIGIDISLKDSRVQAVSDFSAMAWITWQIKPQDESIKKWHFLDVYGFRMAEGRENGLQGGWEFVNADDEFVQLFARIPDFYG